MAQAEQKGKNPRQALRDIVIFCFYFFCEKFDAWEVFGLSNDFLYLLKNQIKSNSVLYGNFTTLLYGWSVSKWIRKRHANFNHVYTRSGSAGFASRGFRRGR